MLSSSSQLTHRWLSPGPDSCTSCHRDGRQGRELRQCWMSQCKSEQANTAGERTRCFTLGTLEGDGGRELRLLRLTRRRKAEIGWAGIRYTRKRGRDKLCCRTASKSPAGSTLGMHIQGMSGRPIPLLIAIRNSSVEAHRTCAVVLSCGC
jgi:hypothetical protein